MPKLSSFTNSFYFWFYKFSKSYCTATVLAVQSSTRWGRQQQQARRLQMETMTTSETTEAAGFGSDTSPRTESGDYDELSQAGSN